LSSVQVLQVVHMVPAFGDQGSLELFPVWIHAPWAEALGALQPAQSAAAVRPIRHRPIRLSNQRRKRSSKQESVQCEAENRSARLRQHLSALLSKRVRVGTARERERERGASMAQPTPTPQRKRGQRGNY